MRIYFVIPTATCRRCFEVHQRHANSHQSRKTLIIYSLRQHLRENRGRSFYADIQMLRYTIPGFEEPGSLLLPNNSRTYLYMAGMFGEVLYFLRSENSLQSSG